MEIANILICEDEILIAQDIQRSLEESGYGVLGIATSPTEALEKVAQLQPDLVLMDINLNSSVDGIQVADVLREHFDIPCIFLTAYADTETVESAKFSQPLGYLLKPLNDRELFTTIEVGLTRLREQKRALADIESDAKILCSTPVLEKALEYEKQLANTEKNAAFRRILARVASEIGGDLQVVAKKLEKLCTDNRLPDELAKTVKSAFNHQEYVVYFIESLRLMTENKLFAPEIVSIEDIIVDAMSQVSDTQEKEVFFATSFFGTSHHVIADKKALKKALINLFSNATEAGSSSPIINVGTSRVYADFPQPLNPRAQAGWYVEIVITDYGRGMSEEQIEQAVEPLYSEDVEGIHWGMGLPTVDNIIQCHGGWMKIDSKEGFGTTVSLYLPQVKNHAVAFEANVEEQHRQVA